ncbi:SNF2-related protein [Phenylobacterium sp.]|uniref:SNF2-related protein n=2 Tax=Phenylobacterium sp. TaxID=1871053 RepID=UPI0025E9F438|nr:SNF2-related protein [Phenylobacterium sp.]MCA3714698.1 ABC transporter permease [Phenylobacterium sp.]
MRLKSSPTLVGWTTGKTKRQGPIELIEVEFPGGPPGFKPASALEQAPNELDLFADFHHGRHSGPRDLKAAITIEKLRGNLTELVYSMGAGRTDFYPHQFKPVLQFVKSALGRILIADEVGLGKTIEALYIWKELQVRDRARRLLVVCPSMLVPKWIRELENAFGIEASAVDALGLLEALRKAKSNPARAFALVASLEGIRPPRDYDSAESVRAELARLLDENPAGEDEALLDLVVIDEAHYLRNRETASNRLGQLLRDAARRLVMLTAMIATAWIVHAPLPPSEAWPGLLSLCVCLHGCALVAASAIQTTATAALALNGLCGIVIALCPIYYPVTHIPRALAPLVEVLPPTLAMSGALAAYAGQGVSLIGLAGLAAWLAAALWAGYGRFPWSDLPAAS